MSACSISLKVQTLLRVRILSGRVVWKSQYWCYQTWDLLGFFSVVWSPFLFRITKSCSIVVFLFPFSTNTNKPISNASGKVVTWLLRIPVSVFLELFLQVLTLLSGGQGTSIRLAKSMSGTYCHNSIVNILQSSTNQCSTHSFRHSIDGSSRDTWENGCAQEENGGGDGVGELHFRGIGKSMLQWKEFPQWLLTESGWFHPRAICRQYYDRGGSACACV